MIIVIAIALIGIIVYLVIDFEGKEKCVVVQEGCCPCTDGGSEICILESEVDEHQNMLDECSEMTLCAAVDNCKDISCKYSNGECIEVEK